MRSVLLVIQQKDINSPAIIQQKEIYSLTINAYVHRHIHRVWSYTLYVVKDLGKIDSES